MLFLCDISLMVGHLDLWDLVSLTPTYSLDCQGGPLWCIAANPTSPHQLAVGSDNGMVCLLGKQK